jgi:hypothetical protein
MLSFLIGLIGEARSLVWFSIKRHFNLLLRVTCEPHAVIAYRPLAIKHDIEYNATQSFDKHNPSSSRFSLYHLWKATVSLWITDYSRGPRLAAVFGNLCQVIGRYGVSCLRALYFLVSRSIGSSAGPCCPAAVVERCQTTIVRLRGLCS